MCLPRTGQGYHEDAITLFSRTGRDKPTMGKADGAHKSNAADLVLSPGFKSLSCLVVSGRSG